MFSIYNYFYTIMNRMILHCQNYRGILFFRQSKRRRTQYLFLSYFPPLFLVGKSIPKSHGLSDFHNFSTRNLLILIWCVSSKVPQYNNMWHTVLSGVNFTTCTESSEFIFFVHLIFFITITSWGQEIGF